MTTEPWRTAALALIDAGTPVLPIRPALDANGEWDPTGGTYHTGYWLPSGWPDTPADPAVLGRWKPGWGLIALGGHAVDFVDIDAHHDGLDSWDEFELLYGRVATYGLASTPSGGRHLLTAPLETGPRANTAKGLDVRGRGGMVFIAPTRKVSKATGKVGSYEWVELPHDLDAVTPEPLRDDLVEFAGWAPRKAEPTAPTVDLPPYEELDPLSQANADARLAGLRDHWRTKFRAMESWDEGYSDEFGGWEKNMADGAFALAAAAAAPWLPYDEDQAQEDFLEWAAPLMTNTLDPREKWEAQRARAFSDPLHWPVIDTPMDLDDLFADLDLADEDPSAPFVLPELIDVWLPQSIDDHGLAAEALAALRPRYRFSSQGRSWVAYRPEKLAWEEWQAQGNQTRALLDALTDKMPDGKPVELQQVKDQATGRLRKQTVREALSSHGTEANWQHERKRMLTDDATRARIARFVEDRALHTPSALCDASELDQDAEVLWAGGRPYDLRRSGEVPTIAADVPLDTPHLSTASCAPSPGPTPKFDRLVSAIYPDPEDRKLVLNLLGLSLTGVSDRAFGHLTGPSGSGKSTLMFTLVGLFGSYGSAVSAGLVDGSGETRFHMASLRGVRLAYIDDLSAIGRKEASATKKLVTGGRLMSERKGKDAVSVLMTHTLWISSNDVFPVDDAAVAARLRRLESSDALCPEKSGLLTSEVEAVVGPFMEGAPRQATLREEGPAILALLMRHAAEYLRHPSAALRVPDHTRERIEDEVVESNPVAQWVAAECVELPSGVPGSRTRALRDAYAEWASAKSFEHGDHNFYEVLTPQKFGARLNDLGYRVARNKQFDHDLGYAVPVRLGLMLKSEWAAQQEVALTASTS